jgi:hypothetical protein
MRRIEMNIIKRIFEEITLESYLPSEIIEKADGLMDDGYIFCPMKNYMDSKNQRVFYTIGKKEIR